MFKLFFDSLDDFEILQENSTPDGLGGFVTEWTVKGRTQGKLTLGSAKEITQAKAEGLREVYTIALVDPCEVTYNDCLKEISTGDIYRITTDPAANRTPPKAKYRLCFANAVKIELPEVIQ